MFKNLGNIVQKNMFTKVNGVLWSMTTGKLGIKTKNGIAIHNKTEVIGDEQDVHSIEVDVFEDFSMAIPAFAQRKPLTSVVPGDIIVVSGKPKGFVTEVLADKGKLRILSLNGNESLHNPPKIKLMGEISGVMVLQSLLSFFGNDQTKMGEFGNSLMPFLMMSGNDKENSLDKILPMMLYSSMTGNSSGGGGFMNNMMQMMMMQSLIGGNGLASLFGNEESEEDEDDDSWEEDE